MTDVPFREAREAAALDRFWDGVIESRASTPLDTAQEDAAIVRVFQDLAQQPPDPAFLSHLEVQLMLGPRSLPASPGNLTMSGSMSGSLPSPAPRPFAPATGPHRMRGALQLVAVAAAAIIVLGLAFTSLWRQEPASPPLHLSALTASSTPELESSETLLVVPLAEVMEPSIGPISGDRVTTWNLFTVEVTPETSVTWDAQHAICCPGPRFEYVLEGTYRVRAEQAMQVVRANNPGAPEIVPAGTEVTLGPGDARITRNTTAFDAVSGAEPLQLLLGFLIIDERYREPVPTGWVLPSGTWQSTDNPAPGWSTVPADLADLQLRLKRVVLGPDATFPRASDVIGQITVATEPRSALASKGDGAARNLGKEPLTVYVLALEPQD